MGNCLLTKLKGVVDNPNLEELNTLTIRFSTGTVTNSSVVVRIPDNHSKLYNAQGTLLYEFYQGHDTYAVSSNTDYVLKVNNKYDLGYVSLEGVSGFSSIDLNVDGLKFTTFEDNPMLPLYKPGVVGNFNSIKSYFEKFTSINIVPTNIAVTTDDVAALSNSAGITTLLFNSIATGSIMALVDMISLSSLRIPLTVDYVNSLQEFLDGMAANRASGTLSLNLPSNYRDNNAGITKYDPVITFSGGTWTWE